MVIFSTLESNDYRHSGFHNALDPTTTQHGEAMEHYPTLFNFPSSSVDFGPLMASLGQALTIPPSQSANPTSTDDNPTPDNPDNHPPPTPLPAFHNRKRAKTHIPRPPNAFMLYRSDFLRKGRIPKEAESKQQNLSRVIGECWKRLDAKGKEHWYDLAKEVADEHAKKYPNYVYKPIRRGCIPKRRQKETQEERKVRCEELRKTFLPETIQALLVESSTPVKKRKPRTKKKVEQKSTVVESLGSLDVGLPSVAAADLAFTDPLIAPSDSDQRILETFHQTAIQEPLSTEGLDFPRFELEDDQFLVYGDEYDSTMSSDNIAHGGFQGSKASPIITTAASELQARFVHDKAAGMATTTAMFDAQYVEPSCFNVQPQFIPSSQLQNQSSSSNAIYFSTDIFEGLVLLPATASSVQFLQPAFQSLEGMTNVNYPMDFPVAVQASEGQYSGNNPMRTQFGSPVGEMNISSEGIDIFDTFNLSDNPENASLRPGWFDNYVPSYSSG